MTKYNLSNNKKQMMPIYRSHKMFKYPTCKCEKNVKISGLRPLPENMIQLNLTV